MSVSILEQADAIMLPDWAEGCGLQCDFVGCDEYNTVFVDRCGKSGVEVPLERKEDDEDDGCTQDPS